MTGQKLLHLPDLLSLFPWGWSKNPYLGHVGPESASWIDSFDFFHGERRQRFIDSDNELLAAYTFPYVDAEGLRIACDFSNVLFVIDELTDLQNGEDATETSDIVLSVIKNETSDMTPVARLVKEFWSSINSETFPNSSSRFFSVFSSYLHSVAREVANRAQNRILEIDDFILERRENSAIRTFFSICEIANKIDLPDAAFENPAFISCYWAAVDMVCHANDLYSYKSEQAHGLEGNNIITVLMHYKDCTVQEAANEVEQRFRFLIDQFVTNKAQVPSFATVKGGYPSIDEDIGKYFSALEQWAIGNIKWSFDTLRYFGYEHEEVGKTLSAPLM